MAGHSKWANIQHRKNAQDSKRGKIFTKLIREITVAARMAGPDAASNPRLRTAVDKALTQNMTRDTIDRAIKRGAGNVEGDSYEELRYEGYGVAGVAVMVDCMTDNRNRTAGDIRHAFTKRGGNLGTDGSVSYLFTKSGVLSYGPGSDENRIIEVALEAGAEDVVSNDDGSIDVLTSAENFHGVADAMNSVGLKPDNAEITHVPATTVVLKAEDAEKVLALIDTLEDLDDVQNVYTNAEFPDGMTT